MSPNAPTRHPVPHDPRRRGRSLLSAFALAFALLGFAACTSNSNSTTAGGTTAVAPTTTPAESTTGSSPATSRSATTVRTATTANRNTTTSSRSGSSSTTRTPLTVKPGSAYPEFCETVATFANSGDIDISDLDKFVETLKSTYQRLAEIAPPEIKADVEAVNAKVQTATKDTIFTLNNDPAVKAASDRIGQWSLTNCGFNPDQG